MTPEAAIVALLLANGPVSVLIGDRIKHWKMTQGVALPYVVFQRLDTKRRYHNQGSTRAPMAMIQVTCRAAGFTPARALADAVIGAIDGYRGTATTGAGSVQIDGIFVDDDRDAPEPPNPGADQIRSAGVVLTLKVHFQE